MAEDTLIYNTYIAHPKSEVSTIKKKLKIQIQLITFIQTIYYVTVKTFYFTDIL